MSTPESPADRLRAIAFGVRQQDRYGISVDGFRHADEPDDEMSSCVPLDTALEILEQAQRLLNEQGTPSRQDFAKVVRDRDGLIKKVLELEQAGQCKKCAELERRFTAELNQQAREQRTERQKWYEQRAELEQESQTLKERLAKLQAPRPNDCPEHAYGGARPCPWHKIDALEQENQELQRTIRLDNVVKQHNEELEGRLAEMREALARERKPLF